MGDSHARSFLPTLVRMADQKLITLSAQLKSSCSWTRDETDHDDPLRVSSCQEFKQNLQEWLLERTDSTDLILTTGYARMLTGSNEERVESMEAVWRPVLDRGVRIVAIRDNPRLPARPAEVPRPGGGDHARTRAPSAATRRWRTSTPSRRPAARSRAPRRST